MRKACEWEGCGLKSAPCNLSFVLAARCPRDDYIRALCALPAGHLGVGSAEGPCVPNVRAMRVRLENGGSGSCACTVHGERVVRVPMCMHVGCGVLMFAGISAGGIRKASTRAEGVWNTAGVL